MQIHFFGATRTTTGSMYLLEINGQRLLLECGLFQGRRAESIERNRRFPFDPASVDAVVISHAHIDLAAIMLEDSAEIQLADAAFVSKKRARKNLPPVEPLYHPEDATRALSQFVAINYDRPIQLLDGITVTFRDAGHILGSAQVVLDVRENGRRFRYLFSGDIGRGEDDILRDPERVEGVDYLQIEATYGGREHEPKEHSKEMVLGLVSETLAQSGKVIIPAFSVGRTQEIVYTLNQLTEEGRLPRVPIYVDSPLSVNATEVYRLHAECFNESITRFLREKTNPFGMENLTYIRQVAHSMKLNELKEPAIIISASGMCEAGRILHHLKNHIGYAKNLIFFIGFCAEHTLGAQILGGRNPVNIFGEPHSVRAKVASIDSFSGHADKNELKRYVEALTGDIKKIAVIHGEEGQCQAFARTLLAMKPSAEVLVPEQGQSWEV
jgi:metallo-beta-lactamase family protein